MGKEIDTRLSRRAHTCKQPRSRKNNYEFPEEFVNSTTQKHAEDSQALMEETGKVGITHKLTHHSCTIPS